MTQIKTYTLIKYSFQIDRFIIEVRGKSLWNIFYKDSYGSKTKFELKISQKHTRDLISFDIDELIKDNSNIDIKNNILKTINNYLNPVVFYFNTGRKEILLEYYPLNQFLFCLEYPTLDEYNTVKLKEQFRFFHQLILEEADTKKIESSIAKTLSKLIKRIETYDNSIINLLVFISILSTFILYKLH